MINFWKLSYKEVKKQRNQLKEERDTLIDDIVVLKAKVSKLERDNHDFKKRNALLMNTVDDLDKENKTLRLQADVYFDEWQNAKKRIEELEKGERKQ